MFDQTFVTGPAKTRRPWTVALSLALQTLLIAVLLIVPLLHVAALKAPGTVTMSMPLQVSALPAKPPAVQPESLAARPVRRGVFVAPRTVPAHTDMTPDTDVPEAAPTITGSGQSGPLLALVAAPVLQPPGRKSARGCENDGCGAGGSCAREPRGAGGQGPL